LSTYIRKMISEERTIATPVPVLTPAVHCTSSFGGYAGGGEDVDITVTTSFCHCCLLVTVDAGTTAFGVLPVLVWKQEMPKVLITE
jgi:hypothetical protein